MSASAEIALLRRLYKHWNGLRRGRLMPERNELDLVRLPALLPKLLLLDVLETREEPLFRYAMLGTDLVDRLGRDFTGRFVHEALSGEHRRFMLDLYREAWDKKGPAMAASEYVSRNSIIFTCQRLVLPLAHGGAVARQLLGMQVFIPGAPNLTKLEFRDNSIRNVRLAAV